MDRTESGFDVAAFIDSTYRLLGQRLPEVSANHFACSRYEYKMSEWHEPEMLIQLDYRYDTKRYDPFAPYNEVRVDISGMEIYSPTTQGFLPFRALGNNNLLTHFYLPDDRKFRLAAQDLRMEQAQITQKPTNHTARKKLNSLLKRYPAELTQKLDIEHTHLFKIDRHYYTIKRLERDQYAAIDKNGQVYLVYYRPTKVDFHPNYTEIFNQSYAEFVCGSIEEFVRRYEL